MAGIGFELKKLFRRKGLFATLRAYGYAGVICTGPMLLGVLLQVGMLVLCGWAGAARADQDLLVCMRSRSRRFCPRSGAAIRCFWWAAVLLMAFF